MSDPSSGDENKGFKGLGGLSQKTLGHDANNDGVSGSSSESKVASTIDSKPLPIPNNVKQASSQTATPESRKYIIGAGIIGLILLLSYCMRNQSSQNDSYAMPEASAEASLSDLSTEQEVPPIDNLSEAEIVDDGPVDSTDTAASWFAESMPPVGSGLVLNSNQIRYCVYEDRRLKAAEAVVDNYSETSVNTFNSMAREFNSRCGYYKYREGALAPIEDEANQVQAQLEDEGRKRMGL